MSESHRRISAAGPVLLAMAASAHAQCSFPLPPPVTIEVAPYVRPLATADLNGDGHVDIVATSLLGHTISVLLGEGANDFQSPVAYATGYVTRAIAVGHFNDDQLLDVATVGTFLDHGLSIHLGNGDGTFQPAQIHGFGGNRLAMVARDFNNDGLSDIAAPSTETETVSVFIATGGGAFNPPAEYPVGAYPNCIASADFNSDNRPDLAVGNANGSSISILFCNPDGTFSTAQAIQLGAAFIVAVETGDFNNDQRPDIAFVSGVVGILRGNADGTFLPGIYPSTTSQPSDLTVGDFNDDGNLDLVVISSSRGAIAVVLGAGNATFQPPTVRFIGGTPREVFSSDVNSDGMLDFLLTGAVQHSVSLLFNSSFSQQPAPAGACVRGGATFSVVALGEKPSYQWQRESPPDSQEFVDLDDGSTGSWDGNAPGVGAIVSGATTPTLSIAADIDAGRFLSSVHSGLYRCAVSSSCGENFSFPAQFTVSTCPADFNCNSEANSQDFFEFVLAFFALATNADINLDGLINSQDFFDFLASFFAGCA
jgi:hypothetical protein